mmetsp:Transcript_4897/g.13592  ORF Transcript_4897/g.13592 Transcript_4897/m.13592 type:complete len:221 (-) Transcript_4897:101-763(-)
MVSGFWTGKCCCAVGDEDTVVVHEIDKVALSSGPVPPLDSYIAPADLENANLVAEVLDAPMGVTDLADLPDVFDTGVAECAPTSHELKGSVAALENSKLTEQVLDEPAGVTELPNLSELFDTGVAKSAPPSDEFDVFIQKPDGKSTLGIALRCHKNGECGPKVLSVRPETPIHDWNLISPENAVQVGDQLLEVNGAPVRLLADIRSQMCSGRNHLRFLRG